MNETNDLGMYTGVLPEILIRDDSILPARFPPPPHQTQGGPHTRPRLLEEHERGRNYRFPSRNARKIEKSQWIRPCAKKARFPPESPHQQRRCAGLRHPRQYLGGIVHMEVNTRLQGLPADRLSFEFRFPQTAFGVPVSGYMRLWML